MQAIDFIVNPISGGKDKSSVGAAILKYLDTTRIPRKGRVRPGRWPVRAMRPLWWPSAGTGR